LEPLVSVIVAAYNAEKHLEECLISLTRQSYANMEILVCNDCSSDHTLEILSRYAEKDQRIRVLSNPVNLQAAASRNRCIGQSRGRYVMIQDSDDVCEQNRVERLCDSFSKDETVQFVSSGYYLFDGEGIYKTIVPSIGVPQKEDFLFSLPFCHAATMFRADCLKKVGGYRVSKETRRGQDYDLFMRLYAAGYRGKNIDDILYGYRVDQDAVSRRKFRYRLDECRIRYRGFKELGLLPKGFPYVLKPIPAYLLQLFQNRRRLKQESS
jgi:glycosyltransferase EpsE